MIRAFAPAMAEEVAAAYNRLVAAMPHCYPIAGEALTNLLPDPLDRHAGPSVALVAEEDGQIRGMIHLGLLIGKQQARTRQGLIRFFAYEPGYRRAGQALLDAADAYWREHRVSEIRAFHYDHNWPFYHVQHVYLSAHLSQVEALLGLNGYQRRSSEVNLDWPDLPALTPEPIDGAIDVTLQCRPAAGQRPGLRVLAHRDGDEIGICICKSLGERSPAAVAQEWFYVSWLGVAEGERGRGLGRSLLERALAEMRGIGYRHATICTPGDNYRAYLFYSNYGFRAVDWTWEWVRQAPSGPREDA